MADVQHTGSRDELLTADEVAHLLGVTTQWVYAQSRRHRSAAFAGVRAVRPRGFEPPRTIRSTRPSTLALWDWWVVIPLSRRLSVLLWPLTFAPFGAQIGAY
jgi:hypothetical protein